MGSIFGKVFQISTFGESHGAGIGVVIDGCPSLLPLDAEEIQRELDRRRPGQSDLSTPRKEGDRVEILSGVYQGKTTGTPIALLVRNTDQRPQAYDKLRDLFRPSHADFTYVARYGFRNPEGGGRASARETIGRVAAGAVAKKLLAALCPGLKFSCWVESVAEIEMPPSDEFFPQEAIESVPVRCPDAEIAARMAVRIKAARSDGDSVGGTIRCKIRGVPAGLGEPVFDRLEADLAKAMLCIPATKGFEIGSGFAGTRLTGSTHNDAFELRDGAIRTATNRSGGVQGGISNGEEINFRVAFKPTPTVAKKQRTVTVAGEPCEVIGHGRHDPCVLPRAVPIVEAMAALVLADHLLRFRSARI
ncbi:chorismate synthase [Candidatus Spyradosoma sp. SGI.093]|uniref:chorismate synthase n=1 Tax=Candidatus Spyradosoma sp. SGI.093 TaxID=3420583 RepID=UPI003D092D1C